VAEAQHQLQDVAWVLRFGRACPWALAVYLTGGLLVAGRLRDPP
jgi:hypothetical protein